MQSTKATAVLKVIAQDCWKNISAAVRETKYFILQTDETETTGITVTQQAAIMLRFFDNTQGQVSRVSSKGGGGGGFLWVQPPPPPHSRCMGGISPTNFY